MLNECFRPPPLRKGQKYIRGESYGLLLYDTSAWIQKLESSPLPSGPRYAAFRRGFERNILAYANIQQLEAVTPCLVPLM